LKTLIWANWNDSSLNLVAWNKQRENRDWPMSHSMVRTVHKSIHCSLQDKVASAVQGETQQTNAFIIYNDNPTRNVDKLTIIGKI